MIKLASIFVICCIFFISCTDRNENNSDQTKKKSDTTIVHAPSANPYAAIDLSPMDMSYFPVNYSQKKMTHDITTPPVMRVIYSRPHRQGRTIFGNLLKYGERWRLGANEATEIEFFSDVNIQGKKVNKGRYVMYCIPYPDKWTIILNTDLFVWGLKIHQSKDLYYFDVPVQKLDRNYEVFTMGFAPDNHGMLLEMVWDDIKTVLPVSF